MSRAKRLLNSIKENEADYNDVSRDIAISRKFLSDASEMLTKLENIMTSPNFGSMLKFLEKKDLPKKHGTVFRSYQFGMLVGDKDIVDSIYHYFPIKVGTAEANMYIRSRERTASIAAMWSTGQ